MMTVETASELMGDSMPSKGALPAVWWLTTDQGQLDAYDRWVVDREQQMVKVKQLATELGANPDEVEGGSYGQRTVLSGFRPPHAMLVHRSHPEFQEPPIGWRVDSKSGCLVPSRRTKKDRESAASRRWQEVRDIPNVRAYLTGLPTEVYLDDRDWGGTSYAVHHRRGPGCVWAYSGGDPDRQMPEAGVRRVTLGHEDLWQRMPLWILAKLMEDKAARIAEGKKNG